MIEEAAIRDRLSAIARHELSLEQFENWFVPAAWNMHQDSSEEAIELASSIHLLLSERDDRILNELELRDNLLSLLNDATYYVQMPMDFGPGLVPRPLPQTANSSPVREERVFLPTPA